MLSRVAAVMAPRTHNCRRVTGSSVRREGGESEPRRPNMSRRVFASAVLLLVVLMCCGSGGTAASDGKSSAPKFQWRDTTDGVTVDSLGAPSLLNVGNEVFAVAEAQCKKNEKVFTGIASQLLTPETADTPEEFSSDTLKKTQVLEEVTSKELTKEVDVSRPTAAVKGSDIYMLVGQYGSKDSQKSDASGCELLLVKGSVSGEGTNNKIDWKDTESSPQRPFGAQLDSWTRLIGSGGSGVNMKDETLVFPVEGTKKPVGTEEDEKTVSLIIYTLKDTTNWTLSKGMSADGCSDPSVVEWKDKLMMMTACDDGRRRVYEIGDKGESWTEALGTLSRVWGNKKGNVKGVRSGFITANIGDGVDVTKRNVMLVTLPVYSENVEKGELHLWLTDNTHIVDIGPVSGNDDVAASALLYRSGNNNNEKLIALYEKKKVDADTQSLGMVFVLLTEQLKRVKDVLTTWREVDKRVSKLCPSERAVKDAPTATACSDAIPTDGLVGFLSGNFSDGTWKDEYLGVNATANNKDGAAKADNGVKFTEHGAGAEWPVGKQGENQLYHFANYNFTLVATVSIHEAPKGDNSIPLMGAKLNDSENTVLLGLSYNNEKKWILLCGGGENKKYSSPWETKTSEHVVVLLRNGNQGSVYVDGQRVGNVQCELKKADSKGISHFYIGGDGDSAGSQEGVSMTAKNVLLYNRPLTSEEIGALNPNKAPIPPLKEEPSSPLPVSSASVVSPFPSVAAAAQIAGTSSTPAETQQTEREQSMGSSGAGSGGASTSAVSAVSTPSAGKDSVKQVESGKLPMELKPWMAVLL
ncbi:trans-sialidase, putative, partial [Trypanosoma cruzi]